nr:hypothetical protein [Tanacetum cinerariifolium]
MIHLLQDPEGIKYFKKKPAAMMLGDSLTSGREDINNFKKKQAFMMLGDSLTPRPEDINNFKKKQAFMMIGDSLTPEEYFKEKHELKMLGDSLVSSDVDKCELVTDNDDNLTLLHDKSGTIKGYYGGAHGIF